jgi:PleD family two-component response regulator
LYTRNVDIIRLAGSVNFYAGNTEDKFTHTVEKMHQQDNAVKARASHTMQDEKPQKENSTQILIVDDSPEILDLLTDILTHHGYRVRPVSSGSKALESMTLEIPDIILLDVKMPDMDGYEVCHHLK